MGEIRGTYAKNGNITEIFLPNGITELQSDEPQRELKVYTMTPKKKTEYRRIEAMTIGNAVALGIAAGGTLGGLWIAFVSTQGMPVTQAALIGVMVYDAIILLQNLLKVKVRK